MPRATAAPLGTLALAATLVLGTVLVGPDAKADPVRHDPAAPYTFAVIGDVPYGDAAQEAFPAFVDTINADPDVSRVTHLGDIKSGSTTCDDARLAAVRADFDRFADPLVYTPGDNEWTDCHRPSNGGYDPLERLATLRSLFFSRPGTTLGRPVPVASQADRGFPENVHYVRGGLSFATLHVVGSNDDLAPWTGRTSPTEAQVSEERSRMAAAVANVRTAFAEARRRQLPGVVLMQQADLFDPTVADPEPADYAAFRPLVRVLVEESRRFHGRVTLFNGDSHRFRRDRPLAAGSPWLAFYGVRHSADGLERVTVDGSDLGAADWLAVTARPDGGLDVEQRPGVTAAR